MLGEIISRLRDQWQIHADIYKKGRGSKRSVKEGGWCDMKM